MSATIINYSSPIPRWKRALDIFFCLLALPILALMTLFMSIMVSLCAPGPVFFRQERVGYQGRRFMIYKFRTMFVGSDTGVHQKHFADLVGTNAPMVKIDARRDSRLIPGGWLLRATGLDELPQMINVWFSDMSLVGPRPCIPYEYDLYEPWQRERFDTLPGLTGLWQVSGKNRTTFEEMMRYDIKYVRTMNWLQDLRIIVMTVPALLIQVYDTRRQRKMSGQPQLVLSSTTSDTLSQRS